MSDNNLQQIKKELQQNVIHIKNYDDVDALLFNCPNNLYVIFDNIALKNYFLNNTQESVINCNSSYDYFLQQMEYYNEKSLFCNLKFCNDFGILNLINKTNNTVIE